MFLPRSRLYQGAVGLMKLKRRTRWHLDDAAFILKLPLFFIILTVLQVYMATWHFLNFSSENNEGKMKVYCCIEVYIIYIYEY